jgi:hypothetical protein
MDILVLFYLLGGRESKPESNPALEFALIVFVLLSAAGLIWLSRGK